MIVVLQHGYTPNLKTEHCPECGCENPSPCGIYTHYVKDDASDPVSVALKRDGRTSFGINEFFCPVCSCKFAVIS